MLAYLRASMARHKVPKYIEFVDAFPMNAAGKVLKYKMREDAARRYNLTGDGADTGGTGK
jgi:fatty-acyl-CoA synthase